MQQSLGETLHLDLGRQKQRNVAHVSGYIPIRCESRQEAGNIMMVPVISVACRRFKTKNTLFSCVLACICVLWQFADLFHDLPLAHKITKNAKLPSIKLELFISPKLVLRMYSISCQDKLMIPIV